MTSPSAGLERVPPCYNSPLSIDPQVRRGVVDCEENPCVRLPCGEGGSCAVVRDQGFQCSCKADFTGESSQVTLILVFLVIFMHFDCEHKDGQGSISPIWQVAAASAAATSATPTPARTPASARGATGWRGPPPSRASARPDSGEGSARTSSTMTGYARGNAVKSFLYFYL